MSIRNLDYLLRPRSVAVIEAPDQPHGQARQVVQNLIDGGFAGPILLVSPAPTAILGALVCRSIQELPVAPDLVVIVGLHESLPEQVTDLALQGTRAAIVLVEDGETTAHQCHGPALRAALDVARPHQFRLLGPESLGVIVPALRLNASLLRTMPKSGNIALVAQSGAITSALVDWATSNDIGFSCVVSLGQSVDVDSADLIDELGSDGETRALLLHVDAIGQARKFISAARAAARNKPVIVLAPSLDVGRGRSPMARAADWAKTDEAFDAMTRRAGMLRVRSALELFGAAEALARAQPLDGDRLAIFGNGVALCSLARRAAESDGVALAALSSRTQDTLAAMLHCDRSPDTPVVLPENAPAGWYATTLQALLADEHCDAVLMLHAPSVFETAETIARACTPIAATAQRAILTAWLGGRGVDSARAHFASAGLPTYGTPEQAVRAFAQLAEYRNNQRSLLQTPPSIAPGFVPDVGAVRAIIALAIRQVRSILTGEEAKSLLRAYHIAVLEPHAADAVRLDSQQAHVLAIGVAQDALFGPVIRFGRGGPGADISGDQAIGLPPLNLALAAELVSRTQVSKLLAGYPGREAVDLSSLCETLVKVAQLVCDFPEVVGMSIDPLYADARGTLASGASVEVRKSTTRGTDHLAIRPYPKTLEEWFELRCGPVMLRPIRAEDGPEHARFLMRVAPADLRLRFGRALRDVPPTELARMTQIDYEREMAFVATSARAEGGGEIVGEIRAAAEAEGARAEFAIVVRSDFQGQGLGRILLEKLIRYLRERRVRRLYGLVAVSNTPMRGLARQLDFEVDVVQGSATAVVTLELQSATDPDD